MAGLLFVAQAMLDSWAEQGKIDFVGNVMIDTLLALPAILWLGTFFVMPLLLVFGLWWTPVIDWTSRSLQMFKG